MSFRCGVCVRKMPDGSKMLKFLVKRKDGPKKGSIQREVSCCRVCYHVLTNGPRGNLTDAEWLNLNLQDVRARGEPITVSSTHRLSVVELLQQYDDLGRQVQAGSKEDAQRFLDNGEKLLKPLADRIGWPDDPDRTPEEKLLHVVNQDTSAWGIPTGREDGKPETIADYGNRLADRLSPGWREEGHQENQRNQFIACCDVCRQPIGQDCQRTADSILCKNCLQKAQGDGQ